MGGGPVSPHHRDLVMPTQPAASPAGSKAAENR
jgi:hypothetical protein